MSSFDYFKLPCPDVPEGGCSICGDGKCVTSPETIFSYPGQPAVECDLLEKAGHGGVIPLDQCTTLSKVVQDGCSCQNGIPMSTPNPTNKRTRAPTRAPTRPTTRAPTPAPTHSPTKPRTRNPTRKPTREPTRAPAPTGPVQCPAFMEDDGCSVCGHNKCVTDEDAIFSYPNQPAIGCKLLEEAGRSGLIPLDQCEVLPQLVQKTCKCMEDGEEQSQPTTSRAPTRPPTRAPTRAPTRSPTRPPTRAPTRDPTRPPTDEPINPFTSPPMMPINNPISTNPPIGEPISAELFAGPRLNDTSSSDAAVIVLGILLMLVGVGTVIAAYFVLQKKTKKKVKDASSLGIQLNPDGSGLAKDKSANDRMSKALKEAIEEDPDLF